MVTGTRRLILGGIVGLAVVCCAAGGAGVVLLAADENHAADKSNAKAGDAEPDHSEHDSAAESHAKGDHAPRGPIEWQAELAIWSLVTFVVFLFVLKKLAWGPLISGLDKREAGIRQAIDDAHAARKSAEEMQADYNGQLQAVQEPVREILAEARRDAEHTKQEILGEAQTEAEAVRKRAVEDIGRARDAAIKDLFDQAGSLVAEATEQVLSRSVNAEDQDRLIEEALSHFSKN